MAVLSYLQLRMKESELAAFERDLAELMELVKGQPGFRWAQALLDHDKPGVYVILSEWESLGNLSAWERQPRHAKAIADNYQRFAGPVITKRYTVV